MDGDDSKMVLGVVGLVSVKMEDNPPLNRMASAALEREFLGTRLVTCITLNQACGGRN